MTTTGSRQSTLAPISRPGNLRILDEEYRAVNLDLITLRDVNLQKDRPSFRAALRRIGYDIGREITRELIMDTRESLCLLERTVKTSLGEKKQYVYPDEPVLVCVLRASLPMWEGMQDAFPKAESGFVTAYRVEGTLTEDRSMEVVLEYTGVPSLAGKPLILVDPMLATGSSMASVYRALTKTHGNPLSVYVAAAIGAPEGVRRLYDTLPRPTIILASLDERLNEKGYIVPGLGDAGDLCFGEKHRV